jgi:hypothetical protein
MDSIIQFEALDTSYVNLAALLRYLRARNFSGRLHVTLDQYEADIFLYGEAAPSVWESNHATGDEAQGNGAMERLLVRSREPGGLIAIYERVEEASETSAAAPATIVNSTNAESPILADSASKPDKVTAAAPANEESDWDDLLRASGELIAAVERAAQAEGEQFSSHLQIVCVELGDDYPFLDPTLGGFEYEKGKVHLRGRPAAGVYVNALVECLSRIVKHIARGTAGAGFRERVAAELALSARSKPNALSEFRSYLDRVAGTRVL